MRVWQRRVVTIALTALLIVVGGVLIVLSGHLPPSADVSTYQDYALVQDFAPLSSRTACEVRVTFLGTTSLLFDDGHTQLLIDGFLTRPTLLQVVTSKIATDTVLVDSILKRFEVDRLAAIFVGHSHYDHASDAAYIARKTGARLFGSMSTLNIGRGSGLPESQMTEYATQSPVTVGQFTVTVIDSKHSPPIPLLNNDIGELITEPLHQPARERAYKEGHSYDLLVAHGPKRILVKPSANYVPGALDHVQADVFFLGLSMLGKQDDGFKSSFYDETVGKVHPRIVVPVHWDNFTEPLSEHLAAQAWPFDDERGAFDYVIERATRDGISFKLMQGFQSACFDSAWVTDGGPEVH